MIRFQRTAQIAGGKALEAIGWSKEAVATAEKLGLPKTRTFIDLGGATGTIRWATDHDDWASYEKATQLMIANSEFNALIKKAFDDGLFIPGSAIDTLSTEI